MAEMTPRTLSGSMELLPKPQQQMERMMDILRRTYALYGFTPLDTPVIEAAEVLLSLLPKLRNRRSRPSPALPPQQTFPEAPQAKAVRLPPPWIRPQPTSWWKQPYQGNPRKS